MDALGIVSESHGIISKFDKDIPFTDLDTDSTYTTKYKDGREETRFHPARRYSTYLTYFDQAAQQFGYKYDGFSKQFLGGHWTWQIQNSDFILPFHITLYTGYVHNDFNFRVSMGYELRDDLKTYDDCYKHLANRILAHLKSKDMSHPVYRMIARDFALEELIK